MSLTQVREALYNEEYKPLRENPKPSLCDGRYVVSVPLPLGLMTIAHRLEMNYYRSALAFKSDVETLTANCQLFNGVCAPSTPLSISLSSHTRCMCAPSLFSPHSASHAVRRRTGGPRAQPGGAAAATGAAGESTCTRVRAAAATVPQPAAARGPAATGELAG